MSTRRAFMTGSIALGTSLILGSPREQDFELDTIFGRVIVYGRTNVAHAQWAASPGADLLATYLQQLQYVAYQQEIFNALLYQAASGCSCVNGTTSAAMNQFASAHQRVSMPWSWEYIDSLLYMVGQDETGARAATGVNSTGNVIRLKKTADAGMLVHNAVAQEFGNEALAQRAGGAGTSEAPVEITLPNGRVLGGQGFRTNAGYVGRSNQRLPTSHGYGHILNFDVDGSPDMYMVV